MHGHREATNLRVLVGRGFVELAAGLAPMVDDTMARARGRRWLDGFGVDRYGLHDPRFLLRVITEERAVFKRALPQPGLHLASELRDIGNTYAHDFAPGAFTASTARYALRLMEKLLRLIRERGRAWTVSMLRHRVPAPPSAAADLLGRTPVLRSVLVGFRLVAPEALAANPPLWFGGAVVGVLLALVEIQITGTVAGILLEPFKNGEGG